MQTLPSHIGLLARTSGQYGITFRYSMWVIQATKAEEILVPMITWDLDGQRLNANAGDVQQSLQAIRDYSVFQVT